LGCFFLRFAMFFFSFALSDSHRSDYHLFLASFSPGGENRYIAISYNK